MWFIVSGGKIWKNQLFSGQIRPDLGNTAVDNCIFIMQQADKLSLQDIPAVYLVQHRTVFTVLISSLINK